MEWDEQKTIRFIEIYRNNQLLWNTKHPQHYKKMKRHDAWEVIAKEIGFPADECKKKMNCLLSAMRREKTKIKKSLGTAKGADEIYKSSWFAYNTMKFLWDKNIPCQTMSSIPNEENIIYETSAETDNSITDCDLLATASLSSSLPPPIQPVLKKRKKPEDARLDKAFELLTASVKNAVNDDELQDFGNFVAKKLRKYSAKTQSSIQNAIMGIFLNADNGLYEQPLYTYNYLSNHPQCSTSSQMSQVSNLSSPYRTPTPESIRVPSTQMDNGEILNFSNLN